jgi:type IV pilus assembly protein PilC
MPIFKGIYMTLGSASTSLPLLTTIVFTACEVIRQYFIYILFFFIAIIFAVRQIIATKAGGRVFEKMILSTPVLGNLYLALAIQKFATTLMVLLKSGILIIKAMEMSANTAESKLFLEKIDEVKVKVTAGLPFSEALQQTGFFPPLVVELVTVGERTGNYPKIFEEIAAYYSDIVDTVITRFTALVEPIMLVVMAMVIGTLVVAMYLPIFKLANL